MRFKAMSELWGGLCSYDVHQDDGPTVKPDAEMHLMKCFSRYVRPDGDSFLNHSYTKKGEKKSLCQQRWRRV